MHFTNKALCALEYDKIINMLASMASTEGAAAKARSLFPTDDYDTVLLRQRRTDDAKRLINAKGYPSFSAPETTVSSAERAYKGAVLSPRELLDIASLLYSARNLHDYMKTDKLFDTSLDEIFDRILVSRTLEEKTDSFFEVQIGWIGDLPVTIMVNHDERWFGCDEHTWNEVVIWNSVNDFVPVINPYLALNKLIDKCYNGGVQ